MNTIENRQYDMLLNVREFGIQNAASFPSESLGGRLFASVGEIADELAGYAVDENSHQIEQVGDVAARETARERLMETMKMFSRTARAMAVTRPDVERKFRVPYELGQRQLIAAAQAFIVAAEPLMGDFAPYELPADALDRLRNDLADFTASVGRRKSGRTMKSRTTASIDDAIARGIEAVRQLDAIVRNKFATNAPVLTAWEQARTVSRPARTTTAQKAAVAASA
jgi:hypothetical protein